MQSQIALLSTDKWEQGANEIYARLREHLLGNKGLIRAVREHCDKSRPSMIQIEKGEFLKPVDLDTLDDRINSFTNKLNEINNLSQTIVRYNFVPYVRQHHNALTVPAELQQVLDYLFDLNGKDAAAQLRLAAILNRVLVESASQSSRSNAGVAGEDMVEAILNAAGLREGVHFSTQFKSKSGSNTDFVLPKVKNYEDSKVEALIAVQMSTNDRARLTASELKAGGKHYAVTGNGLDVVKLHLKNIGTQIVEDYSRRNVILVCYDKEIEREKLRLKKALKSQSKKQDGQKAKELKARLKFVEDNTLSYSEFAKRMKARFSN